MLCRMTFEEERSLWPITVGSTVRSSTSESGGFRPAMPAVSIPCASWPCTHEHVCYNLSGPLGSLKERHAEMHVVVLTFTVCRRFEGF